MFRTLRETIYPKLCLLCRELKYEGDLGICDTCRDGLECLPNRCCSLCSRQYDGFLTCCQRCVEDPPPWEKSRSFYRYAGRSRSLIHAFKYQGMTELIPFCAVVLSQAEFISQCDLICPVPMHFLKRFFRTYNQVELMAQELSLLSQLPVVDSLRRYKWRSAQVRLRRRERLRNIVGVFRAVTKEKIEGKTILLLDDVMTTGATLRACSQVLLDAGAAKIFVLTLARG